MFLMIFEAIIHKSLKPWQKHTKYTKNPSKYHINEDFYVYLTFQSFLAQAEKKKLSQIILRYIFDVSCHPWGSLKSLSRKISSFLRSVSYYLSFRNAPCFIKEQLKTNKIKDLLLGWRLYVTFKFNNIMIWNKWFRQNVWTDVVMCSALFFWSMKCHFSFAKNKTRLILLKIRFTFLALNVTWWKKNEIDCCVFETDRPYIVNAI